MHVAMLPSISIHSSFRPTKYVVMSVSVSTVGVVFRQAWSKVHREYWWDILLSQQMLSIIKHVADDSIICLSATQLMHIPVDGACNAVQQLLCKTLNYISPELWPQHARAELNWLQDLASLQQREYELQDNKIEEIKLTGWIV